MNTWLKTFWTETWNILLEMSPYLLIGFLLAGLLSVIIKQEVIERWLGKRTLDSVIKASLLGVPLPLCSCGVIPVTSSLYQRGASKGATTSFLTSTPQTGIDSILATAGLMGPVFSFFRVVVALVSGIIAGVLVDFFEKENVRPMDVASTKTEIENGSNVGKLKGMVIYGLYTLPQDIAINLVIGILLAGLLSTVLPTDLGAAYLTNPWITYIGVTLVAIPLYVCSTGSIPIAFALMAAGVSPGATLVFLIAGPATNVATITTLVKILGRRTIAIYLTSIVLISWLSGFILDAYGSSLIGTVKAHHVELGTPSTIKILSGIGLIVMLVWTYLYPKIKTPIRNSSVEGLRSSALRVDGMTCSHCGSSISKAVLKIPGVQTADADPKQNLVWLKGNGYDLNAIIKAVADAGFEYKGTV
jgi:uncharacterized membrane protein YraQ (UPF0718 family)/copper chaperone CopZ